ncbi:hypothetical protein D3C71_527240 [compost metagenome]
MFYLFSILSNPHWLVNANPSSYCVYSVPECQRACLINLIHFGPNLTAGITATSYSRLVKLRTGRSKLKRAQVPKRNLSSLAPGQALLASVVCLNLAPLLGLPLEQLVIIAVRFQPGHRAVHQIPDFAGRFISRKCRSDLFLADPFESSS